MRKHSRAPRDHHTGPTPAQMRKINVIRQVLGISTVPATHAQAEVMILNHYRKALEARQYSQIKVF